MSQRRMPSGQGPARGGVRPAGQRVPRTDPYVRSAPQAKAGPTHMRGLPRGRRGGIRRAAGPARRTKAPRKPRRVSGRATALALLLLALTLAYAYPVRVYLSQQAQIDRMQTAQQEQRRRIGELADQVARWDDDDYVTAQARSRQQLVRQGELLYVVGATGSPAGTGAAAPRAPWFSQLWSNLQAVDNPAGP